MTAPPTLAERAALIRLSAQCIAREARLDRMTVYRALKNPAKGLISTRQKIEKVIDTHERRILVMIYDRHAGWLNSGEERAA